ncbi:MAG: ATP-binding protein [Crenarchaeota archaeon]|jgi:DNA replication protein DnaC|nr:ATP-binding protein [Thermoproteota archaeon]
MSISIERLEENLRQLRLVETAKELANILKDAERKSLTYRELILKLTSYELQKRDEKNIARLLNWARFPYLKTLNEFDLSKQQSLTKRQLKELEELSWLEQMFNIILLGPPGAGKTHLAIGIGLEAIQKGFQVAFVTMGDLVYMLKNEEYVKSSQVRLKRIRKTDLLIIDDLMYMAMDQREANFLFHLINHLYEKSSIILTSNKSPEQWTELIGDEGITTAILDRLLHRVEVINLNNDSYRMKHRESIFNN